MTRALLVVLLLMTGCGHAEHSPLIKTQEVNGHTLVCVRHYAWSGDWNWNCQWAPGTPTPNRSDNP